MQTRDQRYARDVYAKVDKIREKRDRDKDATFATSYGAMAHKLPVLIHTSGLAQALAFVDARGREGPVQLLEDLSQTVVQADKKELLARSRGESQAGGKGEKSDLRSYIHLTQQVLEALLWYKRYAQAILDVEAGEDDENSQEGGNARGKAEK
jgi:CRISPR-associated protein Cmr5